MAQSERQSPGNSSASRPESFLQEPSLGAARSPRYAAKLFGMATRLEGGRCLRLCGSFSLSSVRWMSPARCRWLRRCQAAVIVGEVLGGELRADVAPGAGVAGWCVFGFLVGAGAAEGFGQRFCCEPAGCVVEGYRPEHEFGVADLEAVQDPFNIAGRLGWISSDGGTRNY